MATGNENEVARWLPADRKWPIWLSQSLGSVPLRQESVSVEDRVGKVEDYLAQLKKGLIKGLGEKIINRSNRDRRRIEEAFGGMEFSTPRGNLVKRGGFQDWNAGVTLPDEWTSTGAAGMTISRVAAPPGARTGTYSIQIATTGTEGGVTQSVEFHPGKRHTLAFQCYLVSGTGAAVELVSNGTGAISYRKNLNVSGMGLGTGAWFGVPTESRDVGRIKVPADATTLTLKLLSQGTSTVRFSVVQMGQGTERNYQVWEEHAADAADSPSSQSFWNVVSTSPNTAGPVIRALSTGWTEPAAADFTALNTATLTDVTTDVGDGVHTQSASSGSTNTQVLKGGYKAMNYTSGTITLTTGMIMLGTANAYGAAGLFFYESGTGKITYFKFDCYGSNNWEVSADDLSGPAGSTWVRAPTGLTTFQLPNMNKFYLRVTYDGTNMKSYISADFAKWRQFATVSKTEYFTTAPDNWGWAANANTNTGDVDLTLVHWLVS